MFCLQAKDIYLPVREVLNDVNVDQILIMKMSR